MIKMSDQEKEYDDNLWFYHNGCEDKHYLLGNPHTHIGRMYAWCPNKKIALCVSEHEMGDMSIESKYWIKGFLSGNEKYIEEDFGPKKYRGKTLEEWREYVKKDDCSGIRAQKYIIVLEEIVSELIDLDGDET